MPNKNKLLIFAALLGVFLLSINTITQHDVGFHLKNGQYIVEHLEVPVEDIFSFSAPGALWVNHYWLSDVIFYLAYAFSGLWGLILFCALMASLTYFVLIKTIILRRGPVILSALLVIPYAFLTFELWVPRPQIFTYLFTVLLIYILEKWWTGGKNILFFVPILFLIWANSHGGVLIGFPIIGLYIIAHMLKRRFSKELWKILIVAIAALAATFINPNGYLIFTYSSLIKPAVEELNNMEWNSLLNSGYISLPQAKIFLVQIAAVLFLGLITAFKRFRSTKEIELKDLGLVLAGFTLPIIAIRHVGFFPIMTFPIFILQLQNFLRTDFDKNHSTAKKTAILIIGLAISLGFLGLLGKPALNRDTMGVGAMDFIERNSLSGPALNTEFGGYFIWRFWPKEKIFMDGRNEIYLGKVNHDFLTMMRLEPGWEKIIDEYKFNYALIYYQQPLRSVAVPFSLALMNELDFKLVYWDNTAVILVRDNEENKEIIDKYSYRVINPFMEISNIPESKLKEAALEVQRALDESDNSQAAQNYAINFLNFVRQPNDTSLETY